MALKSFKALIVRELATEVKFYFACCSIRARTLFKLMDFPYLKSTKIVIYNTKPNEALTE